MIEAENIGDDCNVREADPGDFMSGRRRDLTISHNRRLELHITAEKIAGIILEHSKPHERCLLWRMVENLLPGEE